MNYYKSIPYIKISNEKGITHTMFHSISSTNIHAEPKQTHGHAFSAGKRWTIMSLREVLLLRGFSFESLQLEEAINPDVIAVAFISTQLVSSNSKGQLLNMCAGGLVLFSFPIVKLNEGSTEEFHFLPESYRVIVTERGVLRLVHSS